MLTPSRNLGMSLIFSAFTIASVAVYFMWTASIQSQPLAIQEIFFFNKSEVGHMSKKGIIFRHGWSSSEDWGTWAEGERAALSILKPKGANASHIVLKIRPMIYMNKTTQDVDIYLDKRYAGRFSFSTDKEIRIPLDPDTLWLNDAVFLDFILRPIRPKDFGKGNNDDRLLSIGLISAQFD